MYHRKLIREQLLNAGVRLGDSCSIFPLGGRKKAFTLNRYCIDLISQQYRPQELCATFIELPGVDTLPFHYRLELDEKRDEGRYVLKTLRGSPFWLNGLAAREAYVERSDRLYIEDHKLNFDSRNLDGLTKDHFEHPDLSMEHLMKSDIKILIVGETGTGKTHLARKIHERSGRPGQFVSINLSSFNPSLIESELFGHKKGAFTGALCDKVGALAQAELGTLFLDEIDSLPIDIQTKLLTFLDSCRYRRVGETKEHELRSRLIFASGRELDHLVKQGTFRRDFYYRLSSGHKITLASLRNEIPRIKEACNYYSLIHSISLSGRLVEFYQTLAWPGNIRQLFGHLDKKRVLSRGTKLDFDEHDEALMLQSSDLMSLSDEGEVLSLQDIKIEHARRVFGHCCGNMTLAAKKLRIAEKTLRSLLQQDQLARI